MEFDKKSITKTGVVALITLILVINVIVNSISAERLKGLGDNKVVDNTFTKSCMPGSPTQQLVVSRYCDTNEFGELCFSLIEKVEHAAKQPNKQSLFAYLTTLEPQYGPVFLWSVDESTENEDSHLDTSVEDTVKMINSTVYYYSARVHRQSVPCGGWSLSYWKDPLYGRWLQLVYCTEGESPNTRICGAFNVRTISVGPN